MSSSDRYKKSIFTCYFEKDQMKAMEWLRKESGIPVSEFIRRAVEKELKKHKIPKSVRK